MSNWYDSGPTDEALLREIVAYFEVLQSKHGDKPMTTLADLAMDWPTSWLRRAQLSLAQKDGTPGFR